MISVILLKNCWKWVKKPFTQLIKFCGFKIKFHQNVPFYGEKKLSCIFYVFFPVLDHWYNNLQKTPLQRQILLTPKSSQSGHSLYPPICFMLSREETNIRFTKSSVWQVSYSTNTHANHESIEIILIGMKNLLYNVYLKNELIWFIFPYSLFRIICNFSLWKKK